MASRSVYGGGEYFSSYARPSTQMRTLAEIIRAAGVSVPSASGGSPSPLAQAILASASATGVSADDKALKKNKGILATLGKTVGNAGSTALQDIFSALDVGRSTVSMGMRGIINEALLGVVNPLLGSVDRMPVQLYDLNGDKVRNEADTIGLARLLQGQKANDRQLYWAGATPGGGGLSGLKKNLGTLAKAGKTPSVFAGAGVYDTNKSDNFATKAGKGALKFVTDAVYDPLTYVTFGTGALGKKAATEAAYIGGEKLAAGLGADAAMSVAAKSERLLPFMQNAGHVAAGATKDDALEALSKLTAEEVANIAKQEVGSQAAAAYRSSQSVGLRKYTEGLGKSLGYDTKWGRDAFKTFADEARGGIRIGNPLTNKTWGRLTEGGGLAFEGKGALGDAALNATEKLAQGRAAVGGSRIGSKLVLGADRAELSLAKQAAAKVATKGVSNLADAAQSELVLAVKKASRLRERKAAQELSKRTAEWATQTAAAAKKYSERKPAWEQALQTATAHLTDANEVAPEGIVAINAIEGVTPDMASDAVTAAVGQGFLNDGYRYGRAQWGDSFATAGEIDGPRRILTKEGRKFVEELKGQALDGFNAERQAWQTFDENGDPAGWWTLAEVNKQMKDLHGVDKFFETDPRKLVEQGAMNLRRRSARAIAEKNLEAAGLMVLGVPAQRNIAPEDAIAAAKKLMDRADTAAQRAEQDLARKTQDGQAERLFDIPSTIEQPINARLSEALARKGVLSKLIADIAGKSGDEQAKAVEALFTSVVSMRQQDLEKMVADLGIGDPKVDAAKKALEELVRGSGGGTQSPVDGFVRVGTTASGLAKGRALQKNFEDKFASPMVAEALTKAYSMRNPTEANKFLEAFDAVTTMWRRLATLGRGPQFVERNLLGGVINGWYAGTSVRHWKSGFEYVRALKAAGQNATRLFEEGKVGRDEIGYVLEREIAKALEGKSAQGVPLYDLHRSMVEQGTLPGQTASVIGMDLTGFEPANLTRSPASSIVGRDTADMSPMTAGAVKVGNKIVGDNPYMAWMARLNENTETMLRSSTFFAGVERYGKDPSGLALADLGVKASQFDYTDLSPFEQGILGRVFPFFVWTKNNIPYQLRTIVNQPGKINFELRGFAAAQEALAGDSENDQYLPDYVKQNMGFTSSVKVGGVPLALGINSPLADVNRFVPSLTALQQGDAGAALTALASDGQDSALGSMHPFIKQGIEAATGTNTYTGNKYTAVDPGPVAGALANVPLVGSTLLGAHRDPKTGKVQVSGYAQNVLRNFLPPVAAAERLSPVGQPESGRDRLAMNWWNAAVGGLLPITPQAAVNQSLIDAGKKRELSNVSAQASRAAGDAGVDPQWVGMMLDQGYTPGQLRRMIATGAGRTGAYEQTMKQRWLARAAAGGFTPAERIKLAQLSSSSK